MDAINRIKLASPKKPSNLWGKLKTRDRVVVSVKEFALHVRSVHNIPLVQNMGTWCHPMLNTCTVHILQKSPLEFRRFGRA